MHKYIHTYIYTYIHTYIPTGSVMILIIWWLYTQIIPSAEASPFGEKPEVQMRVVMYVCMYVCMYECMYVWYVCMWVKSDLDYNRG